MKYLFCVLFGYFIGSINPSYILARIRGFDIREKGSKNAGASNALILFGKLIGVGCAVFDIAKACFSIWLCGKLFTELTYGFSVAGVSCILGHVFPFYMHFRGGKGLACLGGMILSFDWRVFLIMLAAEIVVVIVTDYLCFVPMTASIAMPFVYGCMRNDIGGALIIALIIPVMFYKHKENLARIRNKMEMPFSYLWNKEKALAKTNITEE